MVTNPRKRFSAEEFYALPDCDIRYELVRGYLIAEPLPGAEHGRVEMQIGAILHDYIRRTGLRAIVLGGDCAFELRRSPATVRGPDVAVLALDRYRELADVSKAVPGAPDLAVEVRSPSQSDNAMTEKANDYLGAGAAEVWVVHPGAMALYVHRPGHAVVRLFADDVLSMSDVLPGFRVRVRELIELSV